MIKCLITGNKGFVGTVTQKLFESRGIEVVGFDLMDGRDICDLSLLEEAINKYKPDRILHLAAVARFSDADKDPVLAYETNVRGTQNIAYVASKYHIPVVYSSTGSVYMPIKGTPPLTEDFPAVGNSVYGCSKAIGEKFIMRATVPWIILRYAHLYGKEKRHHGLIGGFIERIKFGMNPILYGGKQSNDFTYIDDVAEANYKAITAPADKWRQIYNIGTGEELTAEQAGQILCEVVDYEGKIDIVEGRTVDPDRFFFSVDKAKVMLGFEAKYKFKDGLKEMFKDEKK